jgi:exopolysaccharide production protein ExoQ
MTGEFYPRSASGAPVNGIRLGRGEASSFAYEPLLIHQISWLAAIFAVLVQQGAFIHSPVLSTLVAAPDAEVNPLNTLLVSLSIALIAPLCLLRYRKLGPIIYGNKAAAAIIVLIFLSTAWSIHPDVTFRRGVNYISTILTAYYLVGRFDVNEIMKILSWATAICAAGSFLFVAAFPSDAIHQALPADWQVVPVDQLTGAWKGVFSHKNPLGHVMAVGVFAELYILSGAKDRAVWHVLLLCGFLALVFLSRSETATLSTILYMLGASLYYLLRASRIRRYFGVALAMFAMLGTTIIVVFWVDPSSVLGIFGKDATLTGRTGLWQIVLQLISERPLLGWGYGAMWLPTDTITMAVSAAVGWKVPGAHNAILETMLQLGFAGLVVVISFVGISLWRSARCLSAGQAQLGMLSLVFFLVYLISGVTEGALAANQDIAWMTFNTLSFCCGLAIMRRQVTTQTL